MQTNHNPFYGKEIAEVVGDATQAALTYGTHLLEKQVDLTRKAVNRGLNRAGSLHKLRTPEDFAQFQRQVGDEELAEIREAGVAYRDLAESVGRDFVAVTDKGRDLFGQAIDELPEKAFGSFPNGNEVPLGSTKEALLTANKAWQRNFDIAFQAFRLNFEAALRGADVVSKATDEASQKIADKVGVKRGSRKK